jgi:uncharacterized membrane protein YccC
MAGRSSHPRPIGLLGSAAERTRLSARARLARLAATSRTVVQAAAATGLAWLVATEVVGHQAPFFAPVAAIITLGLTFGERGRRAVELALGVAVGIAVADLLVLVIGSGVLQLMAVTGLAMALAVLVGGSPVLVTQAAVSAVLVVVLQPVDDVASFARSVDAVIGATSALLVTFLVFPVDPLAVARREAEPVLRELAGTLEDVASALEARDVGPATAALVRARTIDVYAERFHRATDEGREAALAPQRRGTRCTLAVYADAAGQLELAVRNVRVLARAGLAAIEVGDHVPAEVAVALRELADAVRGLGELLTDASRAPASRDAAVRAAARATRVLEETANLSVSVIVGAVRATAADLLRGTGLTRDEAQELVRSAARRAAAEP